MLFESGVIVVSKVLQRCLEVASKLLLAVKFVLLQNIPQQHKKVPLSPVSKRKWYDMKQIK